MNRQQKILILIILFSILIRIPYLNCPLQPDEGAYTYQAYFWFKNVNFYKSRFCNMLPGLPLIYAFIFKTLGSKVYILRLFLSFWNALSVLFIYLITCRILNKKIGLVAAFIFAYLSWLPTIQGIMQKEVYMLLPYIIATYLYLLYAGENEIYLFFSGISLAIAIIIRQTATPLLIHFLLFIFLQSKKILRDSLIFLMGTFLPLFAILLYGCLDIGIHPFFYQLGGYRLTTASIFLGPWWWHLLRFLYSSAVTGIFFLLLAAFFSWPYLDKEREFGKLFILSFFLCSFFGGMIGGRWFFHYYLQITPALSIWLGWSAISILRQRKGIKIVFFVFLLIPFIFYIFATGYTKDFCLHHGRRYDITKKVARYININCAEGQEIYAFLYYNPSLYFLAKRRSAIPYLFRSEVLFIPQRLEEIKLAIEKQKMAYLITYDLPYTIQGVKMPLTDTFMHKIKACLTPEFSPFYKNYPIQISLIRQVFKTIPKYYLPVRSIPFDNTHVIIWKKKD